MTDLALHDRRETDIRLAIVETQLENHLDNCVAAHGLVEKRLGRIEIGIVATLVAILGGGATTIAFLLKIALHLPR